MNTLFEQSVCNYEIQGDYQLPCIATKKQNELHIGVWANRHRQYLKQHHRIRYYNLLTTERLYPYLADIEEQAQTMFSQVQRYIRLTHLIPELLKLVDEERIAFTPAVEISYLPENEQKMLAEEIEYTDATPSLSQAQRLRKFSEQGRLSIDTIFAVLSEEKPNQKEQVKFKTEDIRKYFPKSYTSLDMQKTIINLLEKWQRQRERNRREER